ncbi:MAG: histidine phosphatase family protein [Anaerolineales bacterium]|nr:histidine phosphatase family protein [Anaerolineales bacterium]
MLHLILVRHGETEWNAQRRYQGQSDVLLSELGRRQAELVAERLASQKIDAVYASDLKRAWETAQIIVEKSGLQVMSEPRLRELKFGVLEGLTFDEAQEQYPEMINAWLEDFNRSPQGAETIDVFNARVVSLLNDLKAKHDEQTVLLVAHGGPLSEVLRVVLGLSREKRWYLEMENASLSEALIAETYVSLKRLNDTCHLAVPG